jgi:hypothetical protein
MQIRERKHFSTIFTQNNSIYNSPLISYYQNKDGVNTYEHA